MSHYDVIIVGGGMVGLTLANLLGQEGCHVAIVHNSVEAGFGSQDPFDSRVSALTRATEQLFRSMDVWQALWATQRVSPFRGLYVWEASQHQAVQMNATEIGEDCLGYIVENRLIQQVLMRRMEQISNIDYFAPVTPHTLSLTERGIKLNLKDGPTLSAQLIVGADGARSTLRQLAGIGTLGWDYGHHAMVAVVKTEKDHEEIAWQRFLPTGPLAFLPMVQNHCVVVWSATVEEARRLHELGDLAFCQELAYRFEDRLGKIEKIENRQIIPLRAHHAKRYVDTRIALVGDAAHVIHPLAGQGVNLGFLDAASLAQLLVQAQASHRDLGSLSVLRPYERWRKGESVLMLAAMEAFKQWFALSANPIAWIRGQSLQWTNRVPFVKKMIMRRASGLTGDLPVLAKKFF